MFFREKEVQPSNKLFCCMARSQKLGASGLVSKLVRALRLASKLVTKLVIWARAIQQTDESAFKLKEPLINKKLRVKNYFTFASLEHTMGSYLNSLSALCSICNQISQTFLATINVVRLKENKNSRIGLKMSGR